MTKKWYIIHVASGYEKKVSSMIMEQAEKQGLSEYLGEILVPVEEVEEIRRGKRVNSEKKVFPGYVMINMVFDDKLINLIRSIPKVSKFLGVDGKPFSVSDKEVEATTRQLQDGVSISKGLFSFVSGESVKIIDGPFDSFVGTVTEVDSEKRKLKLSVTIFGRSTPIELDYTQVEKI